MRPTHLLGFSVGAVLMATATLAQAETVTIALPTNVNTLDPHKTATITPDLSVISHVYSSLIIRGPDMELKPSVAKSWAAVSDTKWKFELVEGATFSNGEPLDAAAVKWNIDRVLDPEVNARIASWFKPITEVTVVSPTVVEMVTAKPYPALPAQMSSLFLLAPKWTSENEPASAAMGSGPYAIKDYVSGDRVVLEARSDYWGEKPLFDTVTFLPFPEVAAGVAALQAGDVDIVVNIPPSELERIGKSKDITVGGVPSTRSMFVKYNNLKEPFKGNKKLRQALNYAVDKQMIIDGLLGGTVQPSNCQVTMEGYFGYNADLEAYPYDPDKARQLLKEAGYADGLEIEYEVPLGRYLLSSEINQVIASQLEEVGVKTKIVEMQFGPWLSKYREAGDLGQMSYIGQAWPTLDADGLLSLFEKGNKYAYWPDDDFKALIQEARTTTDNERRGALYKKATELMCDEAPALFLFNQPNTYAVRSTINWSWRPDGWIRAFEMTLAN